MFILFIKSNKAISILKLKNNKNKEKFSTFYLSRNATRDYCFCPFSFF